MRMSPTISYLIARDIPESLIVIILLLPVLITLIATIRQFVGFKAFGIYTALLLSFAFATLSLPVGGALYFGVVITGSLIAGLMRRLRLHYLARLALTLTLISFAMLGAFPVALALGIEIPKTISIFPIVVLMILVEKVATAHFERGLLTAGYLALETGIIAAVCGSLILSETLREALLRHPYWVLITIPINILLGRWTGLRLIEYIRFWKILQYMKKNPQKQV